MQYTELSCKSGFVFQSVIFTFQLAVHILPLWEREFWFVDKA
jgi:hypothetical protein